MFGAGLRHAAAGKAIIADSAAFRAEAERRIKSMSVEATRFYDLAHALQHLGHYLERRKLSLRRIDHLHKKTEVRDIVARLRSAFPEEPFYQHPQPDA